MKIDIRSTSIPHWLIWDELQNLFLVYHRKVTWDLMCDFNAIDNYLKRGEKEFYWRFCHKTGMTHMSIYPSMFFDDESQYKITISEDGFTATIS